MAVASPIRRVLAAFAVLGVIIAIAEVAYYEYAYHRDFLTPNALWLLLLLLNPPSLLGVAFIDMKPTTFQLLALHSVVAGLNGALYAFVASLFLRYRPRRT